MLVDVDGEAPKGGGGMFKFWETRRDTEGEGVKRRGSICIPPAPSPASAPPSVAGLSRIRLVVGRPRGRGEGGSVFRSGAMVDNLSLFQEKTEENRQVYNTGWLLLSVCQ